MLNVFKGQGKKNWLTQSMDIYSSFQTFTSMSFDVFLSKSDSSVKTLIKTKFQKMYENSWKDKVSDSDVQPKLRTYCKFKKEICTEPYLSLVVPKQQMAISKFRCSAHHLAIETGRHQKPKIPVDDRICLTCKTLEDEQHHLIHCIKHYEIRKDLFEIASLKIDNFCNLNPSSKFIELLSCKNLEVQKALAIFLIQASK